MTKCIVLFGLLLSISAAAQLKFPDGSTQTTAFGGEASAATGANATVSGGAFNTASGDFSTVGGGAGNLAEGEASTIAGGFTNSATNLDSAVGGGSENFASGVGAVIAGGQANIASGDTSSVLGGLTNESADINATIGGGSLNFSAGDSSSILGGFFNDATALDASVGGGSENIASGLASTIPGGSQNIAAGDLSFATGFGATVQAAHDGATIFADSRQFFFFTERANEFAVRATGGVRLVTNINTGNNGVPNAGVLLQPGGGTWLQISDRNAKENIEPVDPREVLGKVAELEISEWNYKTQDEMNRHLSPMAQDFYAAFGLGPDDKHVADLDLAGVALAAIQGLYQQTREENELLRTELAAKSDELNELSRRVEELATKLESETAR